MDLAVGDHRVDDPSGVVDRDQAQQPHRSGLGVDLDHGHMSTEREGRQRGLEIHVSAQLVDPASLVQAQGQVAPAQRRLRRPRHVKGPFTGLEHHVGGVGLELLGGQQLGALDHLVGGSAGGDAADLGGFGAVGSGPPGHQVRVALDHRDPLEG